MESKQRTYEPEFCEGAVRIVIETGRPIPEVAEELGVHPGTLHSWISRWRRNGSASSDGPAAAESGGRLRETERAELERLLREMTDKNKRIRELEMEMERDVFKRCMALWVK
ncbi:transposase [Streptomyces sp. NPDC002730]|uniref:transposase n=1 Tax=Streptomyces sp. NPDC002730 TaxID=3364662 RepID=UPI003675A047